MFSIHKMSTASESYYLEQVDYYLGSRRRRKVKRRRRPGSGEDDESDDDFEADPDGSLLGDIDPYTIDTPGEPPGVWWGAGAAEMGIKGMVHEREYRAVFRGFHPFTGHPLVQNAGMPNRRAGWECCFTPPKDVSVIWSQMSPANQERMQEVLWRAARKTLEFIQNRFAFSRVGKASEGCKYVRVGLVVPMFEHASARPTADHAPDPNLHIHAQLLNLGVDEEGHWQSIEPSLIFANQVLITNYYRAAVAAELRAEFGLITQAKRHGFTIPGVPETLVKLYSKRNKVIRDYLAEKGWSGGESDSLAALATRNRKNPLVSRRELIEQWQKTNAENGFGTKQVARLIRHGPRKPKGSIKKVIREAAKALLRQKNHFSRDDLLLQTLAMLPDYGLPPDTVFDEVDHFLAHDPNIVPLGNHDGGPRYTTKRILNEENRMFDALDKMSKRAGITLSEKAVNRQLAKNRTLSEEQVELVRYLIQKGSAFCIGLGLAGTGKTSRVLKTSVKVCQRLGYRFLVVAPTGQAARVVGNEINLQGDTLTKFLGDFKLPWSAALKHHGWQFLQAARGRRTWRFRQPRAVKITPKTIVVVDESGMIPTPQMRILAELVEKGKGKLWLIGDPAQLPAVETTSPLQSLSRRYGAVTLRDIRRQKQLWARRAAKLFAAGRVGPALAAFAKKNRITVRDDLNRTVRQACLDWTAEGLLTPHRVLILANSNDLTHTANQICQEHRLRAGVLQANRSIRVTDEQDDAVYESRLHVHDRVLCTKNSHGRNGYGVDNGSLGTVTAISPFTPEIAVALDDGRHVRINVAKYPHIRLGYAVSTYRSQGSSIAHVHAIVGGILQSMPSSYVQATRGVEDTCLYTTKDLLNASLENVEHSPLAKQMSKRPDLRLASDLLTDSPLDLRKRKPRIHKVPPQRTQSRSPARLAKDAAQPTRPAPEQAASHRQSPGIAASMPATVPHAAKMTVPSAATVGRHSAISIESPGSAADGYQRLRIPAGRRPVSHNAMLQASCVDGGSTQHRNRLPPPPGHAMPYAGDCIYVQRLVPVPSHRMTLADASQSGSFRLEGTGCADYVRVVCQPGEQWLMTVDGPLGLISPQDDIPGAVTLYNKPEILRELTRLDQVQAELCRLLPNVTLLLSLFACLRREASWLLPKASDPAAVTREHLERFCHMLFQNPATRDFLDWFQIEYRPIDELGLGRLIDEGLRTTPYRPSQQATFELGRAIAAGQPWQPHYQQCIDAIRCQFPTPPSQQELYQAVRPLEELVNQAQQYVTRQQISPQQQRAIMDVLYREIGLPVPADARFPSILTHPFQLTHDWIHTFQPARSLWLYATACIRGIEADATNLHQALRTMLNG